jgi:RNA ligase
MKDSLLLNKIWKEVEAGNVSASRTDNLTIFKYTQDCHIQGNWNDVNRQCRGIIFRDDGTVVARPFSKFFNLNELPETEPRNLPWREGIEVYEKLDGSCGTGYRKETWDAGIGTHTKWFIATPGSMESDQAVEGTAMLGMYNLEFMPQNCTPVFEIIYPDNRIVVDYNGFRGLVLLAIFDHNGEEWHPRRVDSIAEVCGFRRPKVYDIDIRGEIPFEDNAEGYVARFGCGTRVKIKSPAYLRIHRLLDRLSPKGVIELMQGREYGMTVRQLPDSIAKDFDDIRAHVQGVFNSVLTEVGEKYRDMMETVGQHANRKAYAMWIAENAPQELAGFVFAMMDGKDFDHKIWKLVLEKVTNGS